MCGHSLLFLCPTKLPIVTFYSSLVSLVLLFVIYNYFVCTAEHLNIVDLTTANAAIGEIQRKFD